jgi:hypothetical protein
MREKGENGFPYLEGGQMHFTRQDRLKLRARIVELRDEGYTYVRITQILTEEGFTRPDGRLVNSMFCRCQYTYATTTRKKAAKPVAKTDISPSLVTLVLNCESMDSNEKLKLLRELLIA